MSSAGARQTGSRGPGAPVLAESAGGASVLRRRRLQLRLWAARRVLLAFFLLHPSCERRIASDSGCACLLPSPLVARFYLPCLPVCLVGVTRQVDRRAGSRPRARNAVPFAGGGVTLLRWRARVVCPARTVANLARCRVVRVRGKGAGRARPRHASEREVGWLAVSHPAVTSDHHPISTYISP